MSSESLYQQGPKYFPCNILSTTQNSELYDSEAENAFFVQLLKLEAFKSHASNPFMLFLVIVAFSGVDYIPKESKYRLEIIMIIT